MTHEQLWAPWRLSYVANPKDDREGKCFLCRYREEENDLENFVVARSDHSLTVLNRFPYNNGHVLVAPHEHKASFDDLSDAELHDTLQQVKRMTAVLGNVLSPDGFNIGLNFGRAAGAGVPGHLHWHIVPRWTGDTNFMPVLGEANVIPQSLQALYELLRAGLQA